MLRPLALSLIVFCAAQAPAHAQTADFSGSLSIFLGTGNGIPATGATILGSGTGVDYDDTAFTIPAGVFTEFARTTPVGFTSGAPQNTLYDILWIISTSNGPGSFSASGSTFSGTMSAGQDVFVSGGLVPFPMEFFGINFPLNVGMTTSVQVAFNVFANAITLSAAVGGWTAGTLSISDQTASAPAGTVVSAAVVSGTQNLGPAGGTISLVAPILIRVRGDAISPTFFGNRAGYARLDLQFVPEPTSLALLATSTLALFRARRRASTVEGRPGRRRLT